MFIDFLFGCRHRHITRPITPCVKPGTKSAGTYVVCLDCGKQFGYDLQRGKPLKIRRAPVVA